MRIRHDTLTAIFDLVYLALVGNALLVASCLPAVVLLLTTDPTRSWPLLAVVAPVCAPGVCAVFALLSAWSSARGVAVVGTFVRAWRACWRPAMTLGAAASGALVVLGVDARAAWGRPVGAVALPLLAVLTVLTVATTLLALVVLAERPAVRLRDALRASLWLAVRHWYLTALSLAVLVVLDSLVVARPAIGLGLAATPLLYAVWANSRYTLRPALGPTRPATN
jgi:uncharacterized membrane protein YesL